MANLDLRQFFWGLSNGIAMLACAGTFWLMLAVVSHSTTWSVGDHYPTVVDGAAVGRWLGILMIPTAALIVGAVRIRRQAAGFSRRDLRRPELSGRAGAITRTFFRTSLVQGLASGAVVWLGVHRHREDLIWPGIALVVSLHFLPLARVFHMRPYYATGLAGVALALPALALPVAIAPPAHRFVLIGSGMGTVMWATAVYVILRADRLAAAWCREVRPSEP